MEPLVVEREETKPGFVSSGSTVSGPTVVSVTRSPP